MTEEAHEVVLLGEWLSWDPESIPASPWNQYVPFLAWLFENLRPGLCVELGSGGGDSFRVLSQIAARFSRGGRFVGIDAWEPDPLVPWQGNPVHDALTEFCATRQTDTASLLRMHLDEAASEFDEASIGCLHIARPDDLTVGPISDPAVWMSRVQKGGVIVVTNPRD